MLAFNLSNWPVSILAQPLRRVAPAAFSALQGDRPRMNAAMGALVVVLAAATLPIILVLAGIAVPLVEFVWRSLGDGRDRPFVAGNRCNVQGFLRSLL